MLYAYLVDTENVIPAVDFSFFSERHSFFVSIFQIESLVCSDFCRPNHNQRCTADANEFSNRCFALISVLCSIVTHLSRISLSRHRFDGDVHCFWLVCVSQTDFVSEIVRFSMSTSLFDPIENASIRLMRSPFHLPIADNNCCSIDVHRSLSNSLCDCICSCINWISIGSTHLWVHHDNKIGEMTRNDGFNTATRRILTMSTNLFKWKHWTIDIGSNAYQSRRAFLCDARQFLSCRMCSVCATAKKLNRTINDKSEKHEPIASTRTINEPIDFIVTIWKCFIFRSHWSVSIGLGHVSRYCYYTTSLYLLFECRCKYSSFAPI